MRDMEQQIQTSTPIIHDKIIPPPPRRLWGQDSATEQLYHNKWVKYRNSIGGKESSWSGLDAPRFVDFENIPDVADSYFDHANQQEFETPPRTLAKPLPGLEENINTLEALRRCSLSAIKNSEQDKQDDTIEESGQVHGAVNLIAYFDKSLNEFGSSTIKNNNADEKGTEVPEAPDLRAANNSAEKQLLKKSKFEKKSQSENRHCTIIEPFSFETREKCKEEHKQARRERDSVGKETWKGFRANPVPNFLKSREKKSESTKSQVQKKKPIDTKMLKLCNAAETWRKKAFQPSRPKKVAEIPKAPELKTAARARERQRFEDERREKERQRQALQKLEEAARKKREDEEIAKLRKELVHKAQPIRKYKMIVPRVEKRPLADPTTPIICKRRRKV